MTTPIDSSHLPSTASYQPLVSLLSESVVGYDVRAANPLVTMPKTGPRRARRLASAAPDGRTMRLILRQAGTARTQPIADEWLSFRDRNGAQVVLEVPGQHRFSQLGDLSGAAAWARRNDIEIAVDASTEPNAALGLLPLLLPDVVRLDVAALHDSTTSSGAAVDAICAFCAHRASALLVDRIVTDRDRAAAAKIGATLGQGDLFGERAAEPVWPRLVSTGARMTTAGVHRLSQPSDLSAHTGAEVLTYGTITRRIGEIMNTARGREPGNLLVSVQNEDLFLRHFGGMYPEYVAHHRMVGVLGAPHLNVPGLQAFADRPAFTGQFAMALVTPERAVCLSAVDIGDDRPSVDRRFEWATTTDRGLTEGVAAAIARRLYS